MQETKAKPQDKRTERDAISEKKDKGANRTEFDKRGDRDDKRGDGRPDRKPKRPDARFKQEGVFNLTNVYTYSALVFSFMPLHYIVIIHVMCLFYICLVYFEIN